VVSFPHSYCAQLGEAGERPALTRNRMPSAFRRGEPDHSARVRCGFHPSWSAE